ncbi:MAG: SprT-like domain-containing protein [Gemmatimonadaceae bacterium]|nr:SprT-like domain-containing protein [Gemmatimonadaceae bacterium]
MAAANFEQLGLFFDTPAANAPSAPAVALVSSAVSPAVVATPPAAQLATTQGTLLPVLQQAEASIEETVDDDAHRPARGRTALRARTAVLFSRLQDLGLRGVDGLVLMRTRTVMVSLIGRTLRVHEGYADAPESVLRAVVAFAIARNKNERMAARDVILAHDVERAPMARRKEPVRPGDIALMTQLSEAHRQLNQQWFSGALRDIPVRLSGRMATRLGHFDPGSRHTPPEIVLSRGHIVKHGWREAMHTLLHEMVHQWQHETKRPVDHGTEFRAKAREVGITPAARRDVTSLEKRKRLIG